MTWISWTDGPSSAEGTDESDDDDYALRVMQ